MLEAHAALRWNRVTIKRSQGADVDVHVPRRQSGTRGRLLRGAVLMATKSREAVARRVSSRDIASTARDARVEGQKSGPRLVSLRAATPPMADELSSRALNVLKLLAPELTGETPPRG